MVALYASVGLGRSGGPAGGAFFHVPLVGLAIIVLFQSEIRRTLARLGRKRWLGFGAGFRAPEAINEILMAVETMAPQHVGALIVLERDIGLRTFIESGVALEARITRDLLLSIFAPGLPLHDGAVIVQKDRVAAAACFLPLTTTPALARELGTRHRAAIGITEETDCLSMWSPRRPAAFRCAPSANWCRDCRWPKFGNASIATSKSLHPGFDPHR
jgi:diadenylate cyclase